MTFFSFSTPKAKQTPENIKTKENTSFQLIIDPKEFCTTTFSTISIFNISNSFTHKTIVSSDFPAFIYHLSSVFPVYFLPVDPVTKNRLDPLNLCKSLYLHEKRSENHVIISKNAKFTGKNSIIFSKVDSLFDLLSFLLYNRYSLINKHISELRNKNITNELRKLFFQRNFFNPFWFRKYQNEITKINNERIIEYQNALNYIKEQNNSPKRVINTVFKKYQDVLSVLYQFMPPIFN